MPNRYHTFKVSALQYEANSKVSINRISIPNHKSGMFDQAKAFFSFSVKVRKLILKKNWDIVVATSSRLMTASLGVWIAKKINSKLYLDIRDLFADTLDNITTKNFLHTLMPLFYALERWTFNSSDKINVVSAGFVDYIKKITPNLTLSVYTNGVDEYFFRNNSSINHNKLKPLILYTGNIGESQGLHKIIPKAANELRDIQFRLIGDGSVRQLLIENPLFNSQKNIEVLNPILRSELSKEFQKADILFLHLNEGKAFQKVLPSKIFEYAASGKPILAGVSGYAAKFLSDKVKGVEVFDPLDLESMKVGLQKLLSGPKIIDRKDFCLQYSRDKIMKKLAIDVLSLYK